MTDTLPLMLLTVRGSPPDDVIEAAVTCGWLPARPPDTDNDGESDTVDDGWLSRFTTTAVDAWAAWGPDDAREATAAHGVGVTVLGRRAAPRTPDVLSMMTAIPFEEADVTGLHPEWLAGPNPYRAPSLGGGMPPHGWLCAFRGSRGHRHLVSRRWLDWGPWRLHRLPGDLSIVEFHDPLADSGTALEQARPGHETLGITDNGGYLQPNFVYRNLPRGILDDTGLLKIIVHGRQLESRELLEACALRVETRGVDPGPIRQVAYVFMEESEAERHLEALAARDLECRAIRLGQEVVLDGSDLRPPRPVWVGQ
jgi:hypothetical protein